MPLPPPVNDECEGAIELTQTATCSPTSGSIQGATNSGVDGTSCFFGAVDDDLWYSFEATTTNPIVEITTGFSSVIEVFSGNCDGTLTSVGCIAFSNQLALSGLTVGDTYYVRIFSYFTGAQFNSNFTICVRNAPEPPANDECAGAISLTQNASCINTLATLAGATDSGIPAGTCDGFFQTANDDVWFSFEATTTNPIVSVTYPGSFIDVTMELFSGSCGSLTSLDCADVPETMFTTGLTVGETYYVRVYSYTTGIPFATDFNICVYGAPAPIENDDCAGAISITQSSTCQETDGSLFGATDSGVPGTVCDGFFQTPNDDVWYSFVATTTNPVVDLQNNTFDAVIELFSGECGTLTSIGCADIPVETIFSTNLTVGETYYVRVFSYSTAPPFDPNFALCVYDFPVPPANDECAGAFDIEQEDMCNAIEGTVAAATNSGVAACAGTATDDVWYLFEATNTEAVVFLNAPFNSVIELLSGDCGAQTSLACSDDNTFTGAENIIYSGLTVGDDYYVRVHSSSFAPSIDNAVFSLCVTTPVMNDDCTEAISLDQTADCEPTAGSVIGATQSLPASTCSGFLGVADDDVWYSFVAETADTTFIDVNANFDSVVELRSGSCATSVSLACSDAAQGFESIEYVGLTVGQTYYIRVYSWSAALALDPNFTICVYGAPDVINSGCVTAEIISTGNIYGATAFGNYNVYEISLVGGTAPYEFEWDNTGYVRYEVSPEDDLLTVFTSMNGTFSVTITDDSGVCTDVITNGGDVVFAITDYEVTQDDGEEGAGTGEVDITVDGGSGTFTYSWSNGETTQDIDNLETGWYSVTVSDGTLEEVGWYWVPEDRRGRDKTDLSSTLKVAPNPASNQTTLTFVVSANAQATVQVFDLSGKHQSKVFEGAIEANKVYKQPISTANLPAGVYVVQLTTDNGIVQQQKLVVTK